MTVNCNNTRSVDLVQMLIIELMPVEEVRLGDVVLADGYPNEVGYIETEDDGLIHFLCVDQNTIDGGYPKWVPCPKHATRTVEVIPRRFLRKKT